MVSTGIEDIVQFMPVAVHPDIGYRKPNATPEMDLPLAA